MRKHLFSSVVAGTLATALLLWGQVAPGVPTTKNMDWTVLVVDDETGEPVHGASVWTVSGGPSTSRHLQPGYFGKDYDEFLKRHRFLTLSDENGFAQMPGQSGMGASAIAEFDGMVGNAWVSFCGTGRIGPPPQPEARLAAVTQQKVLVTDDLGDPVEGAQIGLTSQDGAKGWQLLAMTDAKGMATLQLTAKALEEFQSSDGRIYVQTLGIPPVHAFQASKKGGTLHLQLPKARRIAIEFRNPDGTLCRDTIDFHISNLEDFHLGRFYGGATSGYFFIPALGPGARYFLRAGTWDGKKTGMLDTFTVPVEGEDMLSFTVNMEWEYFSIKGQCLLPDGTPLANTTLYAEHTSFHPGTPEWEPSQSSFWLTTDDAGRFEGPESMDLFDSGPWRDLKFHAIYKGERYSLDFPELAVTEKGPFDLGLVTLQQ